MMYLISGVIATIISVSGLYFANNYGGEDLFGAISYPTSLDTFTNPSATDKTNSPSHSTQHGNANDAIEALEAKVGIDSSAVTTSHDYKLSNVTGSDKACSLTGTETLTNKTLTSPGITGATATTTTLIGTTTLTTNGNPVSIDFGSDALGDIFYRNSAGDLARLGIGSNGQFLQATSTGPYWVTSSANAPTIASSTSSSLNFTANGTTLYVVSAYGSGVGDGTGGDITVTLKYGGITLDTYVFDNPGSGSDAPFHIMWLGTPAATTSAFTLTKDKGTLDFIRINYQAFSS